MKVLVSDVPGSVSHAVSMKNIILSECPFLVYSDPPDANTTLYIHYGTLYESVQYAITNNYNIISRSTTGLSDARNENEGDLALQNNIFIVHAHASNSHTQTSATSFLDIICACGAGDPLGNTCSFGPGLEFYADAPNESEATARIAGYLTFLLHEHPTWNFFDARAALRQTASNYRSSLGWSISDIDASHDRGGYGLVDKSLANAVSTLDPFPPLRQQFESSHNKLTFSWINFAQTLFDSTQVSFFHSFPTRVSPCSAGEKLFSSTTSPHIYSLEHTLDGYLVFCTGTPTSIIESFCVHSISQIYYAPAGLATSELFPDLVAAYFILDDFSGIAPRDLSLQENTCILTSVNPDESPQFSNSDKGSFINFISNTGYLLINNPSWLSYYPFSISFWFKLSAHSNMTIFDHGSQYALSLHALTSIDQLVLYFSENTYCSFQNVPGLFSGNWHFLTLSIPDLDYTSIDQCKLYIDSIEIEMASYQSTDEDLKMSSFRFGYGSLYDFIQGALDELFIQMKIPSTALIKSQFNFGKWRQQ